MNAPGLTLNPEAAIRLRWDHDQELVTAEGLSLCGLCSKPIPQDSVPLRLWANDGVDMATVGECCTQEILAPAAGLPVQASHNGRTQ